MMLLKIYFVYECLNDNNWLTFAMDLFILSQILFKF